MNIMKIVRNITLEKQQANKETLRCSICPAALDSFQSYYHLGICESCALKHNFTDMKDTLKSIKAYLSPDSSFPTFKDPHGYLIQTHKLRPEIISRLFDLALHTLEEGERWNTHCLLALCLRDPEKLRSLKNLYPKDHHGIYRELAYNPYTPLDILTDAANLTKSSDIELRIFEYLASNPNIDSNIIRTLLSKNLPSVKRLLMQNKVGKVQEQLRKILNN